MKRRRCIRRWTRFVAIATLTGLAIGFSLDAQPARAALPEQSACDWNWESAGRAANELFHTASAMDTDRHQLYIYGGADGDFEAQNTFERGDFSSPNASATNRRISAGGALDRVGAAGAYRAKGVDSDDSAVYWIGGVGDLEDGRADSDVQRYATKAGTWTKLRISVTARSFATATYDPVHDVIWVIGGVSKCSFSDIRLAGQTCPARSLPTQYISFDEMTGEPVVNTLSGANVSNFGHTAVYDSVAKRILVYGGTNDARRGNSDLAALDLSDPDPAKAKFAPLGASGRAPRVFFHGAAYDPGRNWMIVNGGVSQGFLAGNESTENKTYALDLATTTPTWVDLGTSLQDRVAGAMEWDANHGVALFTLGRKKYNGDAMRPQNVVRSSHALTCTEEIVPPTNPPPSPVAPTATPIGGGTAVPPTPPTPATPPPSYQLCMRIEGKVPGAARNAAASNPQGLAGYNTPCNPNIAPNPVTNPLRRSIGLRNPNLPYHPLYNGLVLKCGCP